MNAPVPETPAQAAAAPAAPPQKEKSLSDRAGFLITANIIKFAIGIIMPMILVRLLTHAEYGTYQQLQLVGTVALPLLTLGLPTSVFYFYRHISPPQVPALIAQTSVMLAIGGLIAVLVIWVGQGPIAVGLNNPGMQSVLMWTAVSTALMIASEHSISFLIAQNRYGLAVMFEVGEAAIRVVMLLAPLWFGFGFVGLIIGIFAYSLFRFLVRTVFLLKTSPVNFTHWRENTFVREQLHYSLPIAMIALVGLFGSTFNRGFVANSVTPAEFAVFAVGAVVFPFASIFQSAVANVLRAEMPPLVRAGNYAEINRVMRESVRKLCIIVLPAFVFLYAQSYQFITVLFTESYAESVGIFRVFIWELPLDMLILSAVPQIFGKTRANMYINFFVTAYLLTASFVLIKTMGFYGAAVAGVTSQYVAVFLFFIVVLRLMRTTLVKMLPLPDMFRVLMASLVGALASKLVPVVSHTGLVNLIFDGVVFSVVFLGVAIVIGVFTSSDKKLALRWLGKVLPIRA